MVNASEVMASGTSLLKHGCLLLCGQTLDMRGGAQGRLGAAFGPKISAAITVFKLPTKPASSVAQPSRWLDQVREVLGFKHYSWHVTGSRHVEPRFFLRWHGRNGRMRRCETPARLTCHICIQSIDRKSVISPYRSMGKSYQYHTNPSIPASWRVGFGSGRFPGF